MTGEDGAPILLERIPVGEAAAAAVLRLNRPAQLNAIDNDMLQALNEVLDAVEADATVRVVLVTGAGRAFSAGGDLKKYVELQRDPVGFPRFVADLHATFSRLRSISTPSIALINGVTAAGGLELLLNCDFGVVARSARVGDAHLLVGQMGGGGVLTLLPRTIGRGLAAELVLTGRYLSAEETVRWGLANRCVEDDELLPEGTRLAERIAAMSPLAVGNAKEVMNSLWAENASVAAGLRYERERNAFYCLTSEDAPEGLRAFQDKRPPHFTGR